MKREYFIYRLVDRQTEKTISVYNRSYHDVWDFSSAENAREANVHGIYRDKSKFKVAKLRVTEELIEEDCDK